MRILVVDDEPGNVVLLEYVLKDGGYNNMRGVTDARLAFTEFCDYEPDLILLDLMMPHVDGFGVLEQIHSVLGPDSYLPVLVLTADGNVETKRRALSSGATDFLTKPFDQLEVILRIENLLRTRWQHLQLVRQNHWLDETVRERTEELRQAQATVVASMAQLEAAQTEMLGRLAQAAEYRDDDTGQHTYRVGHLAGRIARRMGLSSSTADLIERAAPLHDVGKIGISDTILLKPGTLTPNERDIMRTHTLIGGRLLSLGRSTLVKTAENIACYHHEHWNGAGYPHGIAGEEIPVEAQVVSVADVYDALTHERPYKPAWGPDVAVAEIERQRGLQFSPLAVDAFLEIVAEPAEDGDAELTGGA